MARPEAKKSLLRVIPSQAEWRIEKLVPGGAGFVRLESGQGAFASGALPGERVLVGEAEDHGAYLQATRWSLLEASPARVQPSCPVQSRCGGCDLMTLDYAGQLSAKHGILRDALTRTGRFERLPPIQFVASPEPLAYRSRIRLHAGQAGRIGFYAAETRELVEIPACVVAEPELNTALSLLREAVAQHPQELLAFSELELRVAPRGPRVQLRLTPVSGRAHDASALLATLARHFQVTVGERSSSPEHDQRFPLPGGVELRAPGAAFTQVNWALNQKLVEAVLSAVAERAIDSFCDLYCGAGNFSLPLFARGLSGVGIEASKAAISAAKRAASEQHLAHAQFIAGDVCSTLSGLSRNTRFDLALLDPPRSGARELLPELLRREPRHIAYVACDPVTLSRDLRTLCNDGYALDRVTGFDMFPQTHHFETLAWLTRSP